MWFFGAPMHEYRLYIRGKDGGLIGPGIPIAADNDDAAIERAQIYVNGPDWMLCDGTRVIKEVRHEKWVPPFISSSKSSGWNPTA
jgi:hypothetical protein